MKIRNRMNTASDSLTCVIPIDTISKLEETSHFKRILKFEGEFRSKTGNWLQDPLKFKICSSIKN